MGHHIIEFDEQCKSCQGTGLYVGMAKRDGVAVVCHTCKGTGCHHVKIEYDDFEGRRERNGVKHVVEYNPGFVIGESKEKQLKLQDFGGMSYRDWFSGRPFAPGMENRMFSCPAGWYQSVDCKLKPSWDDTQQQCIPWGSFSNCKHFGKKHRCWARWDAEHEAEAKGGSHD